MAFNSPKTRQLIVNIVHLSRTFCYMLKNSLVYVVYIFVIPRNDAMFTQLHHSGHTCLFSKSKELGDNLQHV